MCLERGIVCIERYIVANVASGLRVEFARQRAHRSRAVCRLRDTQKGAALLNLRTSSSALAGLMLIIGTFNVRNKQR